MTSSSLSPAVSTYLRHESSWMGLRSLSNLRTTTRPLVLPSEVQQSLLPRMQSGSLPCKVTQIAPRRLRLSPIAARGKGFGELLQKTKADSEPVKVKRCPCGGSDERPTYELCCERFHSGSEKAPDAVTLMKSRYSAYAKKVVDYVVETTHPDNPDVEERAGKLRDDVIATCDTVQFKRLEILESEDISDEEALVTFRAIYTMKNDKKKHFDRTLLEQSKFLKDDGGGWLYREKIPIDVASQVAWSTANWKDESDTKERNKAYGGGASQPRIQPRQTS